MELPGLAREDSPAEKSNQREDVKMESRKTPVASPQKLSLMSSPMRAVVRLRRTAHAFKKGYLSGDKLLQRQFSLGKGKLTGVANQASLNSSQYFTFDPAGPFHVTKPKRRKKKSRNPRVLYPESSKKYLPAEHKSKATRFLLLFVAIICFQILNAIENLDDNLMKYDLDGLEKTMAREVFGQPLVIERVMGLLKDYLATHVHNKPLVLSFNGPSGVGKSHIGWLLAKHFRSVMGPHSVLHYFTMHHCPVGTSVSTCQLELSETIGDMVARAEMEEIIPVFILDEVEFMPETLLETLGGFFQKNQTNEYLNAVYVLISNLGGEEIVHRFLQNVSDDSLQPQEKLDELQSALRPILSHVHSFWTGVEIVPFGLLEKTHILSCFYEEMMSEGIYPNASHIERLAGQLSYYKKAGKEFGRTGCKQVVAKVNLL
ncbi:torsin-4A isoform X1 [Pantherophis guttatus]|uniref:Torsin-4A isoform X1 n=2 Tax=Pantherophis guttatus TaxID=94885 RepID=A0ABM3YWV7_PANGU|nr:torsin-4A isoform X1 [Pantherophis guttatus]